MTGRQQSALSLAMLAAALGVCPGRVWGDDPLAAAPVIGKVKPAEQLPDIAPADQKAVEPENLPALKQFPDAHSEASRQMACNPCLDPCFFARADYLLWWIRNGPTPALLTTGPN